MLHSFHYTCAGDPVWVTPCVLEGGFTVPGQWKAGGPLLKSELLLLRQLQGQLDKELDLEHIEGDSNSSLAATITPRPA